jgi:ACS family glucarate transporter-like MFS transporter
MIVILVMGFAALGHFNRVGITVAGDEVFIPELGISETAMGWVYTAFLIVYTTAMLPAGWLIDRIGSARALALYGGTMGTFVVLTGVLGWIVSDPLGLWIGLLVIRGLAGICNAPLHPGAAHVVSDTMSPPRRATANGVITAGALIGIACCYPGYGWLIDTLSWQWAFVVGGGALIVYCLIWRVLAVPSLPHPQEITKAKSAHSAHVLSLLGQGNLWLITLSYAAYSYFQYLIFYWMGYYFKEVLQVPEVDARWASFWIMIAMGAGMMVGGRSTDFACELLGRTRGRRAIVLIGMGCGAVFGFVAVNVEGLVAVAACLSASMAFTGMVEGVFWTTATDIGGKSRGLCGAFMNTGGNAGGLISPVLTPIIAQQLGWQGSIILACAISGVGSLIWLLIKLPESD